MGNVNEWLVRYRLTIIAVLVIAFVFVASYLVLSPARQPKPVTILAPTATPATAKQIKVYVSGAVYHTGVYTLQEGARVDDAIKAAGGPSVEADVTQVNLALRVRDEMQVHVPRVGEGDRRPTTTGSDAKINVNTASAEDLDKLPGIGPVTAARIVDHRSQKGNFEKIEDLRDLKLVSSSVFEKIKDRITVH